MASTSVRMFKGLPVNDATKAEIVTIKKNDLVNGYTRVADYCAIHHALCREQHRKRDDIFVHNTTVYIKNEEKTAWTRYKMSIGMRIQIAVHDQGGMMNEGDYKMLPAPKSSKFDESRAYYRKRLLANPTGRVKKVVKQYGKRERPSYTGDQE